MKKQDYSNHRRWYLPHHLLFYLTVFILFIVTICLYRNDASSGYQWLIMAAIIFVVAALAFMMRQHYALVLQNRIVRLEMRLRYFELTGKRFQEIESALSFKQIAALRFASDGELLPLIDKTISENLSPGSIKKMITHWQADHMRV